MHVLISGAGIAGSTLAWFLAKSGVEVTVVEKAPQLLPHGQNVDVKGNALRVIEAMGLMDQLRQFNTTEKGMRFLAPDGRAQAQFPVRDRVGASYTSKFEILRGDLAAILYGAAKDLPGVTFLFGTTVSRIIANDPNAVKVELSTGELRHVDLLVAADGQWSGVRKQCFPADAVKAVDKGMYAAYWTVPREAADDDWWNIYVALGSRMMSLRPDPHGTARTMFSHMPGTDAQKQAWRDAARGGVEGQKALLRKTFADAGWQAPRLLAALQDAPDFYFSSVQQIRMTSWSRGRVVCLGDAAHAPTLLTGMGTSLAITGAYLLAGELSKLAKGDHPSTALAAYEAVFRPFVDKTQSLPFFVPAVAHPRWGWNRRILLTVAKLIARIVAIPRRAKPADAVQAPEFPMPDYPGLA